MEKKEQQRATTVQEQICNLKDLGLQFDDTDKAKDVLSRVSYYRLIKAYAIEYKKNDGTFVENTKFKDILKLYEFDAALRHILSPNIEMIEIHLRAAIANYIGVKYGPLAYLDQSIIQSTEYYEDLMNNIHDMVEKNSNSPIVRNFRTNYKDGNLPIYALVEICSFGDISKLFKILKNADKKEIATSFGVGYTYLESWMETLVFVRNVCAHYGRLYNARIKKRPKLYKQYYQAGVANGMVFAVILCIKHLLDEKQRCRFLDDISEHICQMNDEGIDISRIGAKKEWKKLLYDGNEQTK